MKTPNNLINMVSCYVWDMAEPQSHEYLILPTPLFLYLWGPNLAQAMLSVYISVTSPNKPWMGLGRTPQEENTVLFVICPVMMFSCWVPAIFKAWLVLNQEAITIFKWKCLLVPPSQWHSRKSVTVLWICTHGMRLKEMKDGDKVGNGKRLLRSKTKSGRGNITVYKTSQLLWALLVLLESTMGRSQF